MWVGPVAWGSVGGAKARASSSQSNRVHLVSHGGYLRARVGQIAWGCVGGAEARANSNKNNRSNWWAK